MKLLRRNTTKFEYFPQTGNETDVNSEGEHTGNYRPEYGTPVTYRGNISVPNGQTQHQFYGEEIRYTHTLVMDNPNIPIQEHGVIRWKGNRYEIKAVHPSLNVLSVALRRMSPEEVIILPDTDESDTDPVQEPAGVEEETVEGE